MRSNYRRRNQRESLILIKENTIPRTFEIRTREVKGIVIRSRRQEKLIVSEYRIVVHEVSYGVCMPKKHEPRLVIHAVLYLCRHDSLRYARSLHHGLYLLRVQHTGRQLIAL